MKTIAAYKAFLLAGVASAALLLSPSASGQGQTESFGFSPNLAIPDNNVSGVADTRTISSGITSLSSIRLTLNISGYGGEGFNGDLYAYVSYFNPATSTTAFSVLLNRVGRTSSNPLGYGDNGLNVTFDDFALNGDIHLYQNVVNPNSGMLTGVWQPDGRNVNPNDALDSSARTANLGAFTGLDPNGQWTLFVADRSAGNEVVLNSWGVELVGVPEPGTYALFALGGAFLVFIRRRR